MSIARCFILVLLTAAAALVGGEPETPVAKIPADSGGGKLPTFPVQSEGYESIKEGTREAPDRALEAIEQQPLLDIIAALNASTPEHLKKNINPNATFDDMVKHPEQYRGNVVSLDGTYKKLSARIPYEGEDGKQITYFVGHVSHQREIISFVSLNPIPESIKAGQSVRLTGIFMKRYSYLSERKPGIWITHTPLIVVRNLEPIVEGKAESVSDGMFIAYLVFAAFLVVIGIRTFGRYRRSRNSVSFNQSASPFGRSNIPKRIFPAAKKEEEKK